MQRSRRCKSAASGERTLRGQVAAMMRAIVNADDFGLSPGINRGIVRAFRDGVLSSTTMMANMPAFEDAVALAKAHPGLGVGVHLTLVWGAPVAGAERVPSLVDRNGRFPAGLGGLLYASGA